jgi:hypothetical protein
VRKPHGRLQRDGIDHKQQAAAQQVLARGAGQEPQALILPGQVAQRKQAAQQEQQRARSEQANLLRQAAGKGDIGTPKQDGEDSEPGVYVLLLGF